MSDAVRSLSDGLWVIDHPMVMGGGIALGARCTIVRLQDGSLWVHSPVPMGDAERAWLRDQGPVSTIVAPNLLHHFYLREAVEAFPDARLLAPAGIEEKVEGLSYEPLEEGATPHEDELPSLHVEGCPKMEEFVFLHRASRTLVITDIAFNFQHVEGFVTRLFLRINGALGRFGPSRLGKRVFMSDHAQVGASVRRILEWDFDRVVLSHGDVLASGGPDALAQGYAWVLD